jgi:FkbM family methyltransferase
MLKIIQIGANSGNDHVFDFISKNHNEIDLAILVEPIPFIISELKDQYKTYNNIIIENIAISDENITDFTLYYVENSNYELSSFSKQHILDHGCPEPKIKSVIVPSLTINQLLDKYNIIELDYLYIDTEGLDVHILGSIDYFKYKINNIIFEIAHTDGAKRQGSNFLEITNYLKNLGYSLSSIDNLNIKASL